MSIKCYKADIPELSRTCITTIIELPITNEQVFVPNEGDVIEQVCIGPVKDHKDMVTVAIILSHPTTHTLPSEDTPSA